MGGAGNPKSNKPKTSSLNNKSNRPNRNSNFDHQHYDPDYDFVDEVISQAVPTKRGKASITHLLDIHYSKPGSRPYGSSSSQSFAGIPKKKSHHQVYIDKKAYLRITCRFILDPRNPGQTSLLLNDPDAPVPYSTILRVIAPVSSCPICLETRAEAPRMLECGHILCMPCLLRYLSDQAMGHKRECPLCFDRFLESKIRPVTFSSADERFDTPQPGSDSVFRLYVRPNNSLVVVAQSDLDQALSLNNRTFKDIPSVDNCLLNKIARIMMGTYSHEIEDVQSEIELLKTARSESALVYEDQDESAWYTKAIQELKKRVSEFEALEHAIQTTSPATASSSRTEGDISDTSELTQNLSKVAIDRNPRAGRQLDDSNTYFFYQTGLESTTKYVLAPLDIRILRAQFGAYSNFPSSVVAKVEHVSHGQSIDESVRKKFKYLSHVPSHTPIALVECDWSGIVDTGVHTRFKDDINKRRQRWREIQRKEDRAKKISDKRERARILEEIEVEQDPFLSVVAATRANEKAPNYDLDPALPGMVASTTSGAGTSLSGGVLSAPASEMSPGTEAKGPNKPSFADAAAGKSTSHDLDEIIEQAQQQAQSGGRKGRKKLVLLSNGGASSYSGKNNNNNHD